MKQIILLLIFFTTFTYIPIQTAMFNTATTTSHNPYDIQVFNPTITDDDSLDSIARFIQYKQKWNICVCNQELQNIANVIINHTQTEPKRDADLITKILNMLPPSTCLDTIDPETGQAPIHKLARLHWLEQLREAIFRHTAGTTKTTKPDKHSGSTYAAIVAGILRKNFDWLLLKPSKKNKITQNAVTALVDCFKRFPKSIALASSSQRNSQILCWFLIPEALRPEIAQNFTHEDLKNITQSLDELHEDNKMTREQYEKICNNIYHAKNAQPSHQ